MEMGRFREILEVTNLVALQDQRLHTGSDGRLRQSQLLLSSISVSHLICLITTELS